MEVWKNDHIECRYSVQSYSQSLYFSVHSCREDYYYYYYQIMYITQNEYYRTHKSWLINVIHLN